MTNQERVRSRHRRYLVQNLTGWLFAAPWVVGFILWTAAPMVASAILTFTNYNIVSRMQFVGLDNWRQAFHGDPLVFHSLSISATYALASVPLQTAVALGLALLLNQPIRGLRLYRTIFYLPSIISGVALAMLFRWLLSRDLGLVNYFLSLVGIQGPAWLQDPSWALPAVVLISLWGIGGMVVIYLAALQSVPTQLYEAAELDGAKAWHKFRAVTLPMISPAVLFQVVMGFIAAFQQFTVSFVLTNGGPLNATLFAVIYVYRVGFEQFRMGYACSIAWLIFFIVLLITIVTLRSGKSWVYYEGLA